VVGVQVVLAVAVAVGVGVEEIVATARVVRAPRVLMFHELMKVMKIMYE
jgi:hypothetical protein